MIDFVNSNKYQNELRIDIATELTEVLIVHTGPRGDSEGRLGRAV